MELIKKLAKEEIPVPAVKVVWVLAMHKETKEKRDFMFRPEQLNDKLMELTLRGWEATLSPFEYVWYLGLDNDGSIWRQL